MNSKFVSDSIDCAEINQGIQCQAAVHAGLHRISLTIEPCCEMFFHWNVPRDIDIRDFSGMAFGFYN